MVPELDLGHGVMATVIRLDGEPVGVAYYHPPLRPTESGRCSGYAPLKPHREDGWDLVSEEPLELAPSLLCRACGHHGFIRGGRWVPA